MTSNDDADSGPNATTKAAKRKKHDAMFKDVFSQPVHARCVLEKILPPGVAEELDWSTLTRIPGEYNHPRMGTAYSDLVFAVNAKPVDGLTRKAMLWFAWEHQSTVDELMAYRLEEYVNHLYYAYRMTLDDSEQALPELVPVVLFQGENWTAPRSLSELCRVGNLPLLMPEPMVELKYIVHELGGGPYTKDPTPQPGFTALAWGTLAIMTLVREDLRGHAAFIARLLDEVTTAHGPDDTMVLMMYISDARKDLEEVEAIMRHVTHDFGYDPESILGKAHAEGELKGVAKTLLKQIELKFGAPSTATIERVRNASADEQDRWTSRILTASTLEEVFTP